MKIAVVGIGYVGLVSGTCFAETGNQVICVDIDAQKVDMLSSGTITIYEPGLEKLFLRNVKEGRLSFTTKLADAVVAAEIIILALPTPSGEDGSADMQYVLSVAEQLGKLINPKEYKVIVDKSTVPVGTAERVRNVILKSASDSAAIEAAFDVVSNPEFLREGVAVDDFMRPDRVIIGTDSARSKEIMQQLYAPFVNEGSPIIYMDVRSAELTKYAANSFLATKITFMNEIARICELLGADVDMVRKGMGTDERIGQRFLFPGIGYGGSCFPKDVKALIKSSKDVSYDFLILNAVSEVNEAQKLHLLPKIKAYFNEELVGKRIAIWGLSFKPNTDDIREAPAMDMIKALIADGAIVQVYDPEAMQRTKEVLGDNNIIYAPNQYEALINADALVIATEWNEFYAPDFSRVKDSLQHPVIFDGRNIFDPSTIRQLGFQYISIGRS